MASLLGPASVPIMGCMTLLVAMVLQVLSFAAPFWAFDQFGDFGLWRKYRCVTAADGNTGANLGCYRQDHPWYIGDWLDAVRAMESLAIIFWSLPLVMVPVYMYVSLGLYYRCWMVSMTALTCLGVVCNTIGFLIYAAKIAENSNWSAGWCFVLCIIADGFGIFSLIIFLLASCRKPRFELQPHYTSHVIPDPRLNKLYFLREGEPNKAASVYQGGHVNPVLEEY